MIRHKNISGISNMRSFLIIVVKFTQLGRGVIESGCGPNMGCFRPSCAHLVYFLRKSTEFHVNQTECQKVLFHLLILIFLSFLQSLHSPPPSDDLFLSRRTTLTLPIAPPELLFSSFQIVYSLRNRGVYIRRR